MRRALPSLLVLALVAAVTGAALAGGKFSKKADALPFTPMEGDLVLQPLGGALSKLIAGVTESPITHVGLVQSHVGVLNVLEAVGPVVRTGLLLWVRRAGGRYAVLRPKGTLADKIPEMVEAAEARLGIPYDLAYEWDDEKLYCSELVYKAAKDAAGVELGALDRLGDLNWRPFERDIRSLAGGELPLDRAIYTPVALTRSPHYDVVYWGF